MKVLLVMIVVLCPALQNAELCGIATSHELTNLSPNLYHGQQEFSLAMLNAVYKLKPYENVFFSPYSTYHALLLAYFGATGETEQELQKTLNLNWASSKEAVRSAYRLEKQNRAYRSKSMPLKFSSADRLYFDESVNLASCLETRLFDEIVQLNIKDNVEQTRQQINNWIANITHNEIKDMLNSGDIDTRTQLVLANAAYFNGEWLSPFNVSDTRMMTFYKSSSEMALAPMMHQEGSFPIGVSEHLGARVLQLPYRTSKVMNSYDSDISMVILLPSFLNFGIELLLTKLNIATLEDALSNLSEHEVDVSLPSFEFEQRLELVPIFREMGIKHTFDSSGTFYDFSNEQKINFGDAQHVAKIKVDEAGSTAAAATVFISFHSLPATFVCNHPFIFLIYDHKARSILFMGIYRGPK